MRAVLPVVPLLASLLATLPLLACNGVFFQPDDLRHSEPSDYDPAPREERIPVGDAGERIAAWAFAPSDSALRGQSGRVRAVVVHFHGNAQNLTSHARFLTWLVPEGFALLAFDYRGYGASDGSPARARAIADGEAAIAFAARWAATLPGSPPVYVVAQSLGGAIAPVAVERHEARHPGTVAGLVLESTFESWRRLAQRKLSQALVTWPLQVPLSYLVSDEEAPSDSVARLRVPLVVLHGDDDPVVPFESGLALYRSAARGRGVPADGVERGHDAGRALRFVVYPGGHTLAFVEGARGTRAALLSFLSGERFLAP